MALLNIPGMTEDALLKTDTAPTSGPGLQPFPCDANGWTLQHGFVVKAEVKTFAGADGENSNLSITVANNQYGAEILINLDPSRVAPGTRDVAKAQEANLRDLMAAIKILGAHTNGRLDTEKLKKASGQVIAFICKHKGFTEKDGRHYHKISYIFKGEGPSPLPQPDERPQLPPRPGTAAPARQISGDPLDDIGF